MSITVDQLYTKLTDLIRTNGLGLLELDGTLHDWTIRRGNIATGDLTTTTARLRIYANQHAAHSATGDLADAGFADADFFFSKSTALACDEGVANVPACAIPFSSDPGCTAVTDATDRKSVV